MRCGLRPVFLWKSEIGVSDLTKVAIKTRTFLLLEEFITSWMRQNIEIFGILQDSSNKFSSAKRCDFRNTSLTLSDKLIQ